MQYIKIQILTRTNQNLGIRIPSCGQDLLYLMTSVTTF